MSLKAFHIAFIVCSSALAFGGGIWAVRHSATPDTGGYYAVAVFCFAGGIGLLAYGAWFLRKLEGVRFLAAALAPVLAWTLGALASPGTALACSVCYGAAEGPFIRGIQLSVIALLGVTYFVVIGLLACFIVLRRRARLAADISHQGAY